jgi:hypothetical protein
MCTPCITRNGATQFGSWLTPPSGGGVVAQARSRRTAASSHTTSSTCGRRQGSLLFVLQFKKSAMAVAPVRGKG